MPVGGEIILSMERMTDVLAFDASSGILTCQAGCVLETLDGYAKQHGYTMPLDLAAKVPSTHTVACMCQLCW